MLNKKSVDDINVKGKRVLVRCDFNVPLIDGKITDENRLVAALPTIKKLVADGGKVILCSHLGKPKGEPKPELSLAPVAVRLSELLGQEVKFAADAEVVGENAKAAVAAMNDGDIVLLENTRYRAEETKNGEAFSKELASLCDVFVNDAFGTAHRAHCSNVGVTQFVDTAVVGYLMQKEIDFLGNAVENPERPFVAILGGSKVSSKISVINNLLEKVDTLIIGGGMCFTFTKAQGGNVGKSLLEEDYLQYALDMIEKAKEMNISIKVETNGASGIQNTLTKEDIQKARCVIVAADKKVEMERFHHKPLIQVPVTKAIYHTEELLQKAMSSNIEVYQSSEQKQETNEKGIRRIYQHLMSGISQIIPILMISGIFISLIPYIQNMGIESEYLTLIYYIATLAINIAIPIMSAFISDSIAGKPAFIVSLVSSILLINMQGNVIEGIILGYIAGYFVLGLSRILNIYLKIFKVYLLIFLYH